MLNPANEFARSSPRKSLLLLAAPAEPIQREFDQLWNALGEQDPQVAYDAIWRLATTPEPTTRFLKSRLKPAPAPDAQKVKALLRDLADPDSSVARKAECELRS